MTHPGYHCRLSWAWVEEDTEVAETRLEHDKTDDLEKEGLLNPGQLTGPGVTPYLPCKLEIMLRKIK